MKMKTLAVLTGVAAPLITTGSAQAGFVGMKTTSKPNDFGLFVVNVYAVFDRPDPGDGSGDHMVAVAGSPNAPLLIEVRGGTFYNHAFGGDQAPSPAAIDAFPSLAFDTFVTIGKKNSEGDALSILPGFPSGITGKFIKMDNSAWFVFPDDVQGDPFDSANSFPGNGHILIGQFSTLAGTLIHGTILMQYVSNGVSTLSVETFAQAIPGPGGLPAVVLFCAMTARRRRRG